MYSKPATRLLPVLTTLLLSGCVAHFHRDVATPPDYQYQAPCTAAPPFRYEPAGRVRLEATGRRLPYHDVFSLSFPSNGDNGHPQKRVEALYLKSRSPGARKLVIVLPIWGTSTYPPSRISTGYAERSRGDAHVIWISGDVPLFPWDELSSTADSAQFVEVAAKSAERYRLAVIDIRRLIDWAEQRPEIDGDRIGIVGFSMSALVTATLLGNEPRVGAAVLMMAAAEFADIFATCGNRAAEVRTHALEQHGWTLSRYREFFAELFAPADPVHLAGRYDPEKVLMIDALFDDCMPRSARHALWEAMGRPERITLLSRHRSAFYAMTPLGLNMMRRHIYRFLDERL